MGPAGWAARDALSAVRTRPWSGRAWRFHRRLYEPLDASGSLLASGRYHRGADQFPAEAAYAALYLALAPEVALGEVLRHFAGVTPKLNEYRLTELEVALAAVLDCRNAKPLGLALEDLMTQQGLPEVTAPGFSRSTPPHCAAMMACQN